MSEQVDEMKWRWLGGAALVAALLAPVACGGGGEDICLGGRDEGETWQQGCNSCVCNADGSITCTAQECTGTCSYDGETYKENEVFPAGDGCNVCTCGPEGAVSCTEADCGNN